MKKIFLCLLLAAFFNGLKSQNRQVLANSTKNRFIPAVVQGMPVKTIIKNSISIKEISTVWSNPASISQGKERLQVTVHYTKAAVAFPKANYPYAGISYRISPKLTAGISTYEWIGRKNLRSDKSGRSNAKKMHHSFSGAAVYRLNKNLSAGASVNFLHDKHPGKNLSFDAGIAYAKPVAFFKNEQIKNQQLHFSASISNLKISGRHEKLYADMPSVLKAGGAYSFTIKLSERKFSMKKQFSRLPKKIDLSLKTCYYQWLGKDNHIYNNKKYQSLIGFSAEATALKMLTLRAGYYSEFRQEKHFTVSGEKCNCFHWGMGLALPLKKWTSNKIPADIKFDVITKNYPDLIDKTIAQRSPRDFRDQKMLFSLGIEILIGK